jgi:hypothetical protein
MASFTDNSQALSTFNPYIQQLPVEAMVKVGMQKQQQYDEGIQKIQTNIDNIAGLDVYRDVDKAYLQTKINELGNNLKIVGAGDFSDFQLVNSVNGMTSQIARDENVRNAVSSTAKIRAGYKKREELSAKGLTDKNNDDYFNKFVTDYTNNTDLNTTFNADYVPYTDIMKKMGEALAKVGEKSSIVEELFVTQNGKPVIRNGKFVYADVKTIDKLVTNKEAVKAAIDNVLSEGDVKQQLGIDGWATYRNTDVNILLEPMASLYEEKSNELVQTSVEITAMLNSTNLSAEDRQKYLEAQKNIQESILENNRSFSEMSEFAKENPESFKQQYYTREFKQSLLKQFTKEDSSRTFGKNEGKEQENWERTFQFNEQVENNKIAYQNATLANAADDNKRAWMEFYRDSRQDPETGEWYKVDAKKPNNGLPITPNKPFTSDVPGEKGDAVQITEEDINTLNKGKYDLALNMYSDLIRQTNDNPNLTNGQILAQAKVYAKKMGISSDQYLYRWVQNIGNKYKERNLTPPPDLQDQINEFTTVRRELDAKVNFKNKARQDAINESGIGDVYKEALKDKKPLNLITNDGGKITIAPEEMIGLVKGGELEKLFMGYGSTGKDSFNRIPYSKNLTPNQYKLLSKYYALPYATRQQIMAEYGKYKGTSNKINSAVEKVETLYKQKLEGIVGITDRMGDSLPMNSADEIKASVAAVASYLNTSDLRLADEGTLEALDNPTAITWIAQKPTNSREKWTGEIVVASKGKQYRIKGVNKEELEKMTNVTFKDYRASAIEDTIKMNTTTNSTNPINLVTSPNAWKTSYFKKSDTSAATQDSSWEYCADVQKANGGYRVVHYIKSPDSQKFKTIYEKVIVKNPEDVTNAIKELTPTMINSIYVNSFKNQ